MGRLRRDRKRLEPGDNWWNRPPNYRLRRSKQWCCQSVPWPELLAAEPASPPSQVYSMWLKTLKASARNSKYLLSVIAKCLSSAMSKFVRHGLRKNVSAGSRQR